MRDRLSVRHVFGSSFAIFRHNALILLPVAVVAAFVPAAVELLIVHDLADLPASIVTTVLDNLATVVFAGAAEELVHRWEQGERHIRLRGVLANVPRVIVPLFVVAILQGILVAVGFLLVIVPGLVFLTFTSVVGPATVAERPGIFGAFRRSFRLVRGNAWRVLGVMLGVELLAVLIGAIISVVFKLLGGHPDGPIALALGETVTLPLEVVAVAVMYWRLRGLEQAAAV